MEPDSIHLILGTAGHIDHGKTSLVRALTGIDTDWLPEEKARGMTIDIGIADLGLGGHTVGVVDVPGHERFVRTMVAGASGIDLVLLVVAADDGVMPQTVEHLDIVSLLGVNTGVVALNKADLADEARLEQVEAGIRDLVANTPLEEAPVVRVSATTGQGLPALRSALDEAVARVVARRRTSFFRVPIDRIFSIPGRGTVVTGSMLGGAVQVSDRVALLPGGQEFRVRGLQTHNHDIEGLVAGQRTAVNLAGLKKEDVSRGMELATPGYLIPSHYLDVAVRCLASARAGLKPFARVRLGLGTSEVLGRLVLLQGPHLDAGQSAFAQLRLHEPVVAEWGQRFILRDQNASRTVGGGWVIRPVARRISLTRAPGEIAGLVRLTHADAAVRVDQALIDAHARPVTENELVVRAGAAEATVRDQLEAMRAKGALLDLPGIDYPLHTAAVDAIGERVCRFVNRFHVQNPQQVGVDRNLLQRAFQRATSTSVFQAVIDRLEGSNRLVDRPNHRVALATFQTEMGEGRRKLWDRLYQELLAGGFKPPTAQHLVETIGTRPTAIKELLVQAEARGEVIQVVKGVYIPAETIEQLKDRMREYQAAHGPFSVSDIRQYVDSTRRYMVPLCEYMDRIGFTRRDGDLRSVAG
jgi:selenocysteine-specific elongation factor